MGLLVQGRARRNKRVSTIREELDIILSIEKMFMDVIHEYPDSTVHLTTFKAVSVDDVPQ